MNTKIVNISLPFELLKAIDAQANLELKSRSSMIAIMSRQYLLNFNKALADKPTREKTIKGTDHKCKHGVVQDAFHFCNKC